MPTKRPTSVPPTPDLRDPRARSRVDGREAEEAARVMATSVGIAVEEASS
jgi:hypothetical protein